MRTDEELVVAARSGEPDAFGPLVERWTERCWNIAWRILHDRDLAADVAQETLLTAWQQLDRLEQPGSFGGWVSRIARNRALDRLERERRAVSTGDHETLEAYVERSRGGAVAADDPVAALDASSQQDLVWAAAAALGERDASVLDLHLRHGMEPRELAEELGIEPNNAHQVLFRLRKRLGGAIRAWLLWRGGRPTCSALSTALAAADVEVFGAEAVAVIDGHAGGCLSCDRDRAAVAAPAAMFSAVPLALMPAALGARVMAGLEQAGVPVPASAVSAASGATGVDGIDGASGVDGVDGGAGDGGAGGGAAGDAGGAGASAEAAGSAAPAEAGGGGAPAEAAGAGASAEAAGAAGGGAPAGGGGSTAVPTLFKVGAGVAAAIAVALVMWFLNADAADPEVDELALVPAPEPPPATEPPVDDLDAFGTDEPAEVVDLPDVLGGQSFSPARPFGDEREPSLDLDGPDDADGALEDATPEIAPPPPPTPDDGNGNGGNGDGDGDGGGDGNGDEDGDGDGDGGDDPDPDPEPTPTITFSADGNTFGCADGLQFQVTWSTEDATGVTIIIGEMAYGVLPPDGSGSFCSTSWDSPQTVTLEATGPGGTTQQSQQATAS